MISASANEFSCLESLHGLHQCLVFWRVVHYVLYTCSWVVSMQDGHCAMVTSDPGGESEPWPLRDG